MKEQRAQNLKEAIEYIQQLSEDGSYEGLLEVPVRLKRVLAAKDILTFRDRMLECLGVVNSHIGKDKQIAPLNGLRTRFAALVRKTAYLAEDRQVEDIAPKYLAELGVILKDLEQIKKMYYS